MGIKKGISIVFLDDAQIRKYNKEFLNKNSATDVLSFKSDSKRYLGDILISVERAKVNSKRFKNTFLKELTLYIIHGLLHLKGFKDYNKKDAEKMRKREAEILNLLDEKGYL